MKVSYLPIIAAILLVCLKKTAAFRGWLVQDFPDPADGGFVIDPDGFLSDRAADTLADKIEAVERRVRDFTHDELPLQMAVAVVGKMNLAYYRANTNEQVAARDFARTLHDSWGVGHETRAGGSGVLIFLSVHDRVVFISRGGALDRLLTNSRLDRIIKGVRPFLKQARYAEGLMEAAMLVGDFIRKGEPTWQEKYLSIEHIILYLVFGGILSIFTFACRSQGRNRRDYANVTNHLSDLDRAQAEARQGRYQATSCPICLENFKSSRVGADDMPIKLLRCGHVFDESCWSDWVNSGQGHVTRCPICQQDVAPPGAPGFDPRFAQGDSRDPDGVFRRFQQERNFRLNRMRRRYPRYVTPSHYDRWTSPTWTGSFAQDPSFMQSNPRYVNEERRRAQASRSRAGNAGRRRTRFGGATSSGGKGGSF